MERDAKSISGASCLLSQPKPKHHRTVTVGAAEANCQNQLPDSVRAQSWLFGLIGLLDYRSEEIQSISSFAYCTRVYRTDAQETQVFRYRSNFGIVDFDKFSS
jgi:hypothetical protein